MKKLTFFGLATSVALLMLTWMGCGSDNNGTGTTTKLANGPVAYGGVFRVNENDDFRNLFPLNITDVISHRIANQVYEGLVTFDQSDLAVLPCLAENWDISDDGLVYTFHLRKNIFFHDADCFPEGKGRGVTADDFVYCMTRLCTFSGDNANFWVFDNKVAGAHEYYESTKEGSPLKEGVSGIKAIDAQTLQITLTEANGLFIKLLAHPSCWVFPKEAYEKYGLEMRAKCVGTGPFMVKTIKEGDVVILQANPKYWRKDQWGNQLPYLDAIRVTFFKDKKNELLSFKNGELDMVFRLPLEMINDVNGELEEAKAGGNKPFELQNLAAFGIDYYGFQHKSDIFKDKRIRQAFNYAIDREALVTYTLQGDGTVASHGIVPVGFKGYPYNEVPGFTFDPQKAKQLLAEAGYPDGNGFPKLKLQLNNSGDRNEQVAVAVQNMLKENLNIEVQLEVMPLAQHYENVEHGKATFWRAGWIADYPDPENFLTLLYGKHVPEKLEDRSVLNSVRYQNHQFDSLFVLASHEIDQAKRYELFAEAERIAAEDAAIMPIYYNENTRLLQMNVKNLPQNAMEYRDFSEVYFLNDTEEETAETK